MLLVRKDKRKIAVQKGRAWNGEIKFEPVLVFGSYEGVGNARIRLWKPLTNDKPTEPKNVRIRKRKRNLNLSKSRGKSQTITPSQKLVTKQLVTVNDKPCAIKEKKSNEDSTGNSSVKNKNKSINNSVESYSPSGYSERNEEYCIEDGSVSESDNINYIFDDLMTSDAIFPHNLIEYHSNINEKINLFKPHTSSDHTNQNIVYTSSHFTTKAEALNFIPDNLMQSDFNNASYSESCFHSTGIKFVNHDEGEKNILESNTNKNKEYTNSQFTRESEGLKNIIDDLMKSDLTIISNKENIFPNTEAALLNSDDRVKTLFGSQNSSGYTHQNTICDSSKFARDREAVIIISDSMIKTDLNKVSYSERIIPSSGIRFSNEQDSKSFESNTNQNKEYFRGKSTIESETIKHNADDLMKSDFNSLSNSESIFPNAVKFLSDDIGENQLFESNMNRNEEYVSNQLLTVSEALENVPDKLTNSDLNKTLKSDNFFPDLSEFPSDIIYANTSQYTGHNSTAFSSLENLKSESDDFYQNIKKNWSLDSSKVLMTPSKGSIKSKNSVAPHGYDMIQVDESHNVDFIQLVDPIEGNLNNIINEHQLSEQSISNLKDEEDENSNYLKNDQIIKLKDYRNHNLNELQYKNQMYVKPQNSVNGNFDDNQFSNNNVKFIVLKKSQENQETILDSSEEIEKNIFTRNNISPGFESLINVTIPKSCEHGDKLLVQEADTVNAATSKNYSLADVLHDELTKNYGTLNFETRVKVTKVDEQKNRKFVEKKNFTHPNNVIEDKTVKDLFSNKTVQKSFNGNVQKENRGESKYEISLESNEDEEKSLASSMHTVQKYFNALSEFESSQGTTLSKTEKIYLDEMLKKSLEFVSEGTSGKTIGDSNKKNLETNKNVYNTFFKHTNKNHPSLSRDPNNNFPMMKSNESKPVNEELLYHLVSKSNHNFKEADMQFSETKKCTDDIINKIIQANTHEELLLLIKPRHPQIEEVTNTQDQEAHTSTDKKEPKHLNIDSPLHLAFECDHTNQNSMHSGHIEDFIKTYEREASVKDDLNKKFSSSNSSSKDSINILHSIATPSCNITDKNEIPENFRLISEEKEQSNLIMNVEINHEQRNGILQDSIINGNLSAENSTGAREKNIQETNLFYTNNLIKSPYINPHSKYNMIVNFDNERKNSVTGKIMNCFRKLNIWSKRKSATSLSSKKSYSNKRYI